MSFSSEREFRMWDYNVSHNQLLIRSPRSPDVATNVDIIFWRVEYMELPCSFRGIAFAEAAASDVARVQQVFSKISSHASYYPLISEEKRHLIVASGFKVVENTLDIFNSSLCYFVDRDPSELGVVLAHS